MVYGFLQPNWYITYRKNHFFDANYLRMYGYQENPIEHIPNLCISGGGPVENMELGIVIRDNFMEDGFHISVGTNGVFGTMSDLVIQGNQIRKAEFGLRLSTGDADGVVVLKNCFENVEIPYTIPALEEKCRQKNPLGDSYQLFLDIQK